MAHQGLATYQRLVQLVQQLPGLNSRQLLEQRAMIVHLGNTLTLAGPLLLSRAAWEKLIKDKVVYQLGTVCCSLLEDVFPDSFSAVSAMRAELALYALDLLLGKAADTFCRDYSAEALLGGGFSNPLAAAVAEQLQQSGLLQKYPTHAQGAATLLRQATAAAAAATGLRPVNTVVRTSTSTTSCFNLSHPTSNTGSSPDSSTTTSSTGQSASSASRNSVTAYRDAAASLGRHVLSTARPLGVFQAPLEALPAMLESCASLVLALLQHVEHRIALNSRDHLGPLDLEDMLPSAEDVLFFIRSSTFLFWLPFSPQQRQMLLTPSMVAVISVLVYTVYLNTCLPLNTSSSGSSSSSGGGFGVHQSADAATQDSIIAAAAAAASATVHRSWIYLRHQAEQGTAAFRRHLSGTDAVLKQHGISNATVAFLAAYVDYPDAVLSVQDLLRPAMRATHEVVGATYHMIYQQPQLRELLQLGPMPPASVPGAQQQQHTGSIGSASDLHERLEANVLAGQLLLYSVLQQQQRQQEEPQSAGSSNFVSFCAEAAGVAKNACSAMAGHLHLLEQPPANSQTSTTDGVELVQLLQMLLSPAQTSTAGRAELAALRRVMKQWVDDALPVLVQLLQMLLSAALNASSSSTGSASSSSAGVGCSNSQFAAATPAATTQVTPPRALVGMMQLLCIAAKASSWQEDDPDPSVKVKYLAHGWTAYHVQLCAACDGAFRSLAPELSNTALMPLLTDMLVAASECLFANSLGVLVVPANLSAPGSDKEMQLFSCLVTFVKLAGLAACTAASSHSAFSTAGKQAIWQVVAVAVNYLVRKTGSPAMVPALTAAEAALNTPGSGLPWLWLIGRCFLLWVAQLRQLQQQYTASQLGQRLMQLQPLQGLTTAAAWQQTIDILGVDKFDAVVAVFGAHHLPGLRVIGSDCTQWLLQNGNAAKLAADGYPTMALLQQLQSVTTSAAAAVCEEGPAAAAAGYGRVLSQLEALALTCESLPVSRVCNNPYCSNMQGATEAETVTGRSCRCSQCHVAQYCSRVCQKQHWKQHKPVCKALAAAQQTAANC